MDWMRDIVATEKLVSLGDLDFVSIVDTPEEAIKIIKADFEKFQAEKLLVSGS